MSHPRHEDWQLLDLSPDADLDEINRALHFRRSLYQPGALATYNLLEEDEQQQYALWSVFAGGIHRVESDSVIVPGRWYHLAGVYDGSTARLFVNGALAAEDGSVRASFSPRSVERDTRVRYRPQQRPMITTPAPSPMEVLVTMKPASRAPMARPATTRSRRRSTTRGCSMRMRLLCRAAPRDPSGVWCSPSVTGPATAGRL